MKLVKKTKTHKIYQRKDERYAVQTIKGTAVNADEKVALLQELGLVVAPTKAPEPEVVEVAAEEVSAEEKAETEVETEVEEKAEAESE